MKIFYRITGGVAIPVIILLIVGFLLPGEKMVSRSMVIDKMYFYIMMDITAHYEEATWRSDLDSVIQQESIDGLDVWLEKYHTGDSALIKTIKTTEYDLVREIVNPNGKDRLRIIQLKEIGEKTAIKMTEEVIIENPFLRVWYLIEDGSADFVETYLSDLKEKCENEPEDPFRF